MLATLGHWSTIYCRFSEPPDNLDIQKEADFHQMVANIADIPRGQAKTINLGLFYGMGKAKLQGQLGVTEEQAKDLLDNTMRVPFVKQLYIKPWIELRKEVGLELFLVENVDLICGNQTTFGMKPQTFEEASLEHGSRNIKKLLHTEMLDK